MRNLTAAVGGGKKERRSELDAKTSYASPLPNAISKWGTGFFLVIDSYGSRSGAARTVVRCRGVEVERWLLQC